MSPGLVLTFALLLLLGRAQCASSKPPRVLSFPIRARRRHTNETLPHQIRRHAFNASVQNFLPDRQYFVTVGIGNPPQVIELLLTTGVSDTWVFAPGSCKDSQDHVCFGGVFNSANSTTYRLRPDLGLFKIAYISTLKSNGPYFQDDLTIGGVTVRNLIMGLAVKSSGVTAGAFGIGFQYLESRTLRHKPLAPYKNFPYLLKSQDLIPSTSYSIFLNSLGSDSGTIIFGGYDTAKFYGNLTMFPVVNSPYDGVNGRGWYISLSRIGISSPTGTKLFSSPHDPYPIPTEIDSANTLSTIPFELFSPFIKLFDLSPMAEAGPGNLYEVDCGLANKFDRTSVIFSFGTVGNGGITIRVPLPEMIVPSYSSTTGGKEPGVCLFGVQPMAPNLVPTLGQTLLRSAYALFNLDGRYLGLAQAKYGTGASEILEYGGIGADKRIVTDFNEPDPVTVNYVGSSYIEHFTDAPVRIETKRVFLSAASYPTARPPRSFSTVPSQGIGAVQTTTRMQTQPSGPQKTSSSPPSNHTGNGGNGGSGGSNDLGIKVGVPVGIVALVIITICVLVFFVIRRRKRRRDQEPFRTAPQIHYQPQSAAYAQGQSPLAPPPSSSLDTYGSPALTIPSDRVIYGSEVNLNEKANSQVQMETPYRSGLGIDTNVGFITTPAELSASRDPVELSGEEARLSSAPKGTGSALQQSMLAD